tara:strand:+ start:1252 stop:1707 length:456 start_codon:yes stop_codon:yes gene_type:complete
MKKSIITLLICTFFCISCTKDDENFESSTPTLTSNGSTPGYLTDSFVKANLAQGTWLEYNIYYSGPNGFYNTNSDPGWSGDNLSFNATEVIWNNNPSSTETYTVSGLVLYSSTTFQDIKIHMEENGKTMFLTNTNVSYQAFNRSVTEYRRI